MPIDGADQVGGEEAQQDVAQPQPAERQAENGGKADVAEAEKLG